MKRSLGPGAGGGALSESFPSTPKGSPPLWVELAPQVRCGLSLLICHILLPLIILMILLSFFHKEIGILQLNPRRRKSRMGRVLDWRASSWLEQRVSQGRRPRIAQRMLLPLSSPLCNPKQKRETGSEESGGKENHFWNVCHLS